MKRFIAPCLAFALISGIVGCASTSSNPTPSDTESQKPIELTYLAHVTPNWTPEMYQGIVKRYEELHPNITVTIVKAPDQATNDYAKSLLASGSLPDVLQNIGGDNWNDAGALLEIPIGADVENIKDYEKDLYWKDHKLYTLSPFFQPTMLVFYNKKLFAQSGIRELPKSWDEFNEVCLQLANQGITPLELGGEWTASFVFGEFISADAFGKAPNWFADRYEGKVHFTDDNFVKPVNRWVHLVESGYVNKGATSLTANNMEAEFIKGKIAMYPMGSWTAGSEVIKKADMELGVFLPPTEDGQQRILGDHSGAFAVSSQTKYPKEALQFIKFMALDPEVSKEMAQKDSQYSNLVNSIAYEMTPLQKEISTLVRNTPVGGHYNGKLGGRGAANGMYDAFGKVAQDILLGKTDTMAILRYLDESWDKNAAKQ